MQVWIVPLRLPPHRAVRCLATLDTRERERADRLATGELRSAHAAAHTALRAVLGAALGCEPAWLRFGLEPLGKPFLARPPKSGLHFNLSHAGEIALIALSRRSPVGVDIEMLPPDPARASGLLAALSPQERAAIAAAPAPLRALVAHRCWVRKEALLKAAGCGLWLGMDNFSVDGGRPARLRESRHPWLRPDDWALRALEQPGRWTAAIALRPPMPRAIAVRRWHWGDDTGLDADRVRPSPA